MTTIAEEVKAKVGTKKKNHIKDDDECVERVELESFLALFVRDVSLTCFYFAMHADSVNRPWKRHMSNALMFPMEIATVVPSYNSSW